jgi:hypothetical protein
LLVSAVFQPRLMDCCERRQCFNLWSEATWRRNGVQSTPWCINSWEGQESCIWYLDLFVFPGTSMHLSWTIAQLPWTDGTYSMTSHSLINFRNSLWKMHWNVLHPRTRHSITTTIWD